MISRLILVHPDPQLRESLRYGFEREGIHVTLGADAVDASLFAQPAELVVAGGRSGDEARAILARIRDAMAASGAAPSDATPVLYVGNGIGRTQALAGGASEFLGEPVYLRDAVTAARLLAGRKRDNPSILTGELGEHFGLFYLVRAVSALGRRGVLTLVRGMRRGELRFYDGEVTSAQVGFLHGLAALHQLLLWTEGRFEFRPEDVVRRQQIPLDPPALFADAERFLSEICAAAGRLSPSACYERDPQQLARVSGRIPPEVGEVLQLFDGGRTVADVVEDSPFRVFETLRIGNRLAELGLVRLRAGSGARTQRARAPLAIDEWLVGDRPAAAGAPTHQVVAKPQLPQAGQGGHRTRKERRKNKRGVRGGGLPDRRKPQQVTASPGSPLVVDWEQVLPGTVGSDHAVSPVVPSSVAAGEIGAVRSAPPIVPPPPDEPPDLHAAATQPLGVRINPVDDELLGATRKVPALSDGPIASQAGPNPAAPIAGASAATPAGGRAPVAGNASAAPPAGGRAPVAGNASAGPLAPPVIAPIAGNASAATPAGGSAPVAGNASAGPLAPPVIAPIAGNQSARPTASPVIAAVAGNTSDSAGIAPVAANAASPASPGMAPAAARASASPPSPVPEPVAARGAASPPSVAPIAAAKMPAAAAAKVGGRGPVAPSGDAPPRPSAPAKVSVRPPGQPIVPSRNVEAPAPPRTRARSSAPPPTRESTADGFSASEEAFFARGAELAGEAEAGQPDDFADLDEGQAPPQSFWRRLFRSPTSYSEPPRKPPRRRR